MIASPLALVTMVEPDRLAIPVLSKSGKVKLTGTSSNLPLLASAMDAVIDSLFPTVKSNGFTLDTNKALLTLAIFALNVGSVPRIVFLPLTSVGGLFNVFLAIAVIVTPSVNSNCLAASDLTSSSIVASPFTLVITLVVSETA